MNEPKYLKSFSEIELKITQQQEDFEKNHNKFSLLFDEDIASEIISFEVNRNELIISLKSIRFYNKIFHQKKYWLNRINEAFKDDTKTNISKLKVQVIES